MWCKVGDIYAHNTGKALNRADNSGQLLEYITTSNLYWDTFVLDDLRMMYFTDDEIEKCTARKGDLLVCEGGDIGRAAIWPYDYDIRIQNHIHRLRGILPVNNKFYLYVLQLYKWSGLIGGKGIGLLGFSSGELDKLQIPLPPLNEQNRIVDTVERLFFVVKTIDEGSNLLNDYIADTKARILTLAISGKLVPQDPSEEPAIDLLRRIKPDFVACDNSHYPFEIPLSWVFAYGKDLFAPMRACKPTGEEFLYIDIDSVDNKNNVITSPKRLRTENAPSRASRFTQKGDVVFSMVRPYLKNIAVVPENHCIASTGFYVCSPKVNICSDYLYYMMLSPYVVDGLNMFMKGDNSPSINTNNILQWKYPVPPLNEQKRIIEKIKRLFSYLDKAESLVST